MHERKTTVGACNLICITNSLPSLCFAWRKKHLFGKFGSQKHFIEVLVLLHKYTELRYYKDERWVGVCRVTCV